MKPAFGVIAAGLVLALGACSGAGDQSEPDPVALVKVDTVAVGAIDERITIYGAAENGTAGQYTLSSPVEAVVSAIEAPVGSNVVRGQIVIRLNPSPGAQLELANVAATAAAADLAYDRAKRLRADGLVSDAEVESARAAKASADATAVSLAGRNRSLTLRSPDKGFVEVIGASAGQLVAPGTPVVTIAKDDDINARFGIDPALARRVPAKSSITITAAGGGPPITLPVVAVDPTVDAQTKLAALYVRIPKESEIGAGESLSGSILLGSDAAALTIPYAALLDDGGQPYVFIVQQGIARRVDVTVGPRMGDRISVTKGLSASQQIVVDGLTALEDGMKVRTK